MSACRCQNVDGKLAFISIESLKSLMLLLKQQARKPRLNIKCSAVTSLKTILKETEEIQTLTLTGTLICEAKENFEDKFLEYVKIETIKCNDLNGLKIIMDLMRSTQRFNISFLDLMDDELCRDGKWTLLGLTQNDSKAFNVTKVKASNPKNSLLENLLESNKGWNINTVQVVLPPNENGTVGNVELFGNQLTKASPEQVTSLWNQTSHAWWVEKDGQEEEGLWNKYLIKYGLYYGSNRCVKKIEKATGSEGLKHILNTRKIMFEMLEEENKNEEVEGKDTINC